MVAALQLWNGYEVRIYATTKENGSLFGNKGNGYAISVSEIPGNHKAISWKFNESSSRIQTVKKS